MEILKYGDERLEQVCEPVTELAPDFQELILDMFTIMYQTGGIGLAAPQVGINKRFFIADIGDGQRLIFINPRITNQSDPIECIEGCLSFPGVYVNVVRYKKIFVKAQDITGKSFKIKASGLLAQVVQHEIEHLDGILLTSSAVDKAELELKMKEAGLIAE